MPKRTEKKYKNHPFYYINWFLIVGVLFLKIWDIAYSSYWISIFGYSIETNPYAEQLLTNPFSLFMTVFVPLLLVAIFNYIFRESPFAMIMATGILIFLTCYHFYVFQNNLEVGRQLQQYLDEGGL